MYNPFPTVSAALLEPGNISTEHLQELLKKIKTHNVDAADLYFQYRQSESWILEDGIIKEASFNLDHGVGVRAMSGAKTGFAYADEINLQALHKAATAAQSIVEHGQEGTVNVWRKEKTAFDLYNSINPLATISDDKKIALLRATYAEAKKQDPRLSNIIVSLVAIHDMILVASDDGVLTVDIRPLVRMSVQVIATDGGRSETGTSGGGGRIGYDFFEQEERALKYAREAVRLALINLKAQPAPAGTMPVVLGPGWAGVILHEAVGHGLEGDLIRKGSSTFAGRLGQKVASPLCTVVDQGNLEGNKRGSLHIDDEGTKTQCTVLIENGILRNYMFDKLNARLMQTKSTGNGRRESYASIPIPRMTNTYMLAGKHHPEEIIASIKKGLYAINFSGGQVDTTSGKFVFTTSEAYLIENGKITTPIKNAALIGSGPEVLTKVSMVGNDLKLDTGIGTCGKDGQSVPVGVGQPTLKVDELTVGGTK
jgi:TldD protein